MNSECIPLCSVSGLRLATAKNKSKQYVTGASCYTKAVRSYDALQYLIEAVRQFTKIMLRKAYKK
jgi:hypothetical protein